MDINAREKSLSNVTTTELGNNGDTSYAAMGDNSDPISLIQNNGDSPQNTTENNSDPSYSDMDNKVNSSYADMDNNDELSRSFVQDEVKSNMENDNKTAQIEMEISNDAAGSIVDNNDYRPNSLRLESVLEYTNKIKAFLGLEEESVDPDSNEKLGKASPTESIPILRESISEVVPDILEEVINKIPIASGTSRKNDIDILEPSIEQMQNILEINDSETIPEKVGDLFDANVEPFHQQPIPDILEKNVKKSLIESGIETICHQIENNNFHPLKQESENEISSENSVLPETEGDNKEYPEVNDVITGVETVGLTPIMENDANKVKHDLDQLGCYDEQNIAEQFTFNEPEKENSCQIRTSNSKREKQNESEDSEMEENAKKYINKDETVQEDTDLIIAVDKVADNEETREESPYQIMHIEEGLREVQKSSDSTENEIVEKSENVTANDDEEKEIFSNALKFNKSKNDTNMEDLRRLSTEVVNSVIRIAGDQVKVILHERNSAMDTEKTLQTIAQEIENNSLEPNDEKNEIIHGSIESNICEMYDVNKEINDLPPEKFQDLPISPILNPLRTESRSGNDTGKIMDIELDTISGCVKRDTHHGLAISDESDPDTRCGFSIFNPECLQQFATARIYLILYSIVGILHGSYYTYLVGVLSTLEKRFEFKSKTSGTIMMMDELTPLFLGVLVGHCGGRAHRPRMLSFGMFLSAFCCFASALPYFLYGTATHLSVTTNVHNTTLSEMCDGDVRMDHCDTDDRPPTLTAIMLLMLGSFLKGFGNLAYYAIGLAYLDDNAKKKNTPLYLAIAFALRLVGPMVGFLMSSAFLKYYENPLDDPGFGPEDPRWIGGWWMGFMLQGILLLIFAGPLAFFPRRLPGHKIVTQEKGNLLSKPFEGLLDALKRLFRNPLYVLVIFNTILSIYGNFGFYINLPKYMEYQFRMSASNASLFAGPPAIAALMVSTILGGYLIWKFKPRARILIGGLVAVEVMSTVGYLLLMIPQCEAIQMQNFGYDEESLILENACNINCNCSTVSFNPICGRDGEMTYFSPCYAGCRDETNQYFSNCSCVEEYSENSIATKGLCKDDNCWSQALAYIVTLPILQFICNTMRVAHTILLLRCIKPEDKNIALGVFETMICTFAFIPFPIFYGVLVDSACLVWEKSCGETGNCWFYDMGKFNYLLHGSSALFTGLSSFCMVAIFFLVNRVQDLYEEGDVEAKETHSDVLKEREETGFIIKI